jgi:Protein of unknown function (DUF3052)
MAAGYSGTPLAKKLGIKVGARVAFLDAPDGFDETVAPLPDGVDVARKAGPGLDVVVFFTRARGELEERIEELRAAIAPAGGLWVGWPKRASGVETDVTEDVVREVALPLGLVDNKVCAIDETWSGLRLVIRRENR